MIRSVFSACFIAAWLCCGSLSIQASERPNILWIIAEDASAHIGCYGETTIRTPHLDGLAQEGVRFTHAVVTSPVCSPSRSAMITGLYPTTLGAHNHRSQRSSGKGGGNENYFESFRLPVPSVPELFRRAGYHVTNRRLGGAGKTDYNFGGPSLYEEGDWAQRKKGQPFFAQIQLHGGKARRERANYPVNPAAVTLPPYYPDDPVLREDWADYLASWRRVDHEVGGILGRLREQGVLRKTVILFWTDHGVSHLRGKQFLYDEGIRIPLIVRFGDGRLAGSTRTDLVEHIDVAAVSLAAAGIDVPEHIQGRDIFATDYVPREYVFSARDRCDETVDIIRSVRTGRFKYIRNFLSNLPHAQPNRYKDGKTIVRRLRELHGEGKLTKVQAHPFEAPRPAEELYDLRADPFETINLAAQPEHRKSRDTLRGVLYDWMVRTRDMGLIPEPILEDLGRQHGNKYHVLKGADGAALIRRLLTVLAFGERGNVKELEKALLDERASVRYWALTWIGNRRDEAYAPRLAASVRNDPNPTVRTAAALSLVRMGRVDPYLDFIARQIDDENLIVGMYAIRALEHIGPAARAVLPAIEKARKGPYEFTRRFAHRLTKNLQAAQ